MKEISFLMEMKFKMPERWLSCYVSVSNLLKLDLYTVFYSAFLKGENRELYKSDAEKVFEKHHVSNVAKCSIKAILSKMSKKRLTEDGETRKEKCIERLFHERLRTEFILNFYVAVLPLLKKYVMLFEMKAPIVHQLYEKQIDTFKQFLVCFCKPEIIKPLTAKQLKTLELTNDVIMKSKDMYIGGKNFRLINCGCSTQKEVIGNFLEAVSTSYKTTVEYLQKKLPLTNPLL